MNEMFWFVIAFVVCFLLVRNQMAVPRKPNSQAFLGDPVPKAPEKWYNTGKGIFLLALSPFIILIGILVLSAHFGSR
jgi:hypothetical protein